MTLVADRVAKAVVPLFKVISERRPPELTGSAVAVALGSDVFLLTARHVVDELEMRDFVVAAGDEWMAGSGQIVRSESQDHRPEVFDAAVIRPAPGFVNDHLRRVALVRADLDLEGPPVIEGSLAQLIGCPSVLVTEVGNKRLQPGRCRWAGIGVSRREYAKRGKRPDVHTVFRFDRATSITAEGELYAGPDMRGASGGGIWRMLPSPEDVQHERWGMLNAIFTDYVGRTIVGTRVEAHIDLIKQSFPDALNAA